MSGHSATQHTPARSRHASQEGILVQSFPRENPFLRGRPKGRGVWFEVGRVILNAPRIELAERRVRDDAPYLP